MNREPYRTSSRQPKHSLLNTDTKAATQSKVQSMLVEDIIMPDYSERLQKYLNDKHIVDKMKARSREETSRYV